MGIITTDRLVSGFSFSDAAASGDIPAMVASSSALAATMNNKVAAIALSAQVFAAASTSLSNKVVNNQGVVLSDVMSVQAALGSLIGASATYAGEHIN